MKLTRHQRARFFAGAWPILAGRGKPPVESGYVHRLSSRLSFEVLKVRLVPGGWRLHYRVVDDRETRFLLLPTAASFRTDEHGVMLDEVPPEEEIGYTRNPRRRTVDSLPTVPPDVQTVIQMRGRLETAQRRESDEERAKRDLRSVTAQIRETALTMIRSGIDPNPWLTDLQRQINEQREQMEEAA